MRVHRKLATLRDPDRFVPWLLAMARNAAYDAAKSRRRRLSRLQTFSDLSAGGYVDDPHIGVEVADALDRLDGDMREALVLVGITGLSYAEAAQAIGIPEGTVKSRVFRARRLMIEMLDRGADHAR